MALANQTKRLSTLVKAFANALSADCNLFISLPKLLVTSTTLAKGKSKEGIERTGCIIHLLYLSFCTNNLLMETVFLQPLRHRGAETIAILAPGNGPVNLAIRKLPGVKWSQSKKVWYMPWGKTAYDLIVAALQPLANLDTTTLRHYLNKRSEVKATMLPPQSSAQNVNRRTALPLQTAAWKLSKENLEGLRRFLEELKLKAYSQSTQRTYRNEFLQLLQLLKNKPVNELTQDDLRRYFVYCYEKLKLTENTLHSRINAVHPVGLKNMPYVLLCVRTY